MRVRVGVRAVGGVFEGEGLGWIRGWGGRLGWITGWGWETWRAGVWGLGDKFLESALLSG